MSDPVEPSVLWYYDRSRVEDGRSFCQRARALGYHLGANGYGIAMKATKVPLMTGIIAHDGLAPILRWCSEHDELIVKGLQAATDPAERYLPVPTGVVREGIAQALAKYHAIVTQRGFAYLEANEEVQAVIREQQYLIEGLIWAWCLEVLAEVLTRGRVIEVEVDDAYVHACTCGLGDGIGSAPDHEARGCQGIALMCRPDFLLETRFTKEIEYHEFKTTGMDSVTFRDKWEVMIQMFAATLDAERRLGRHVQSIYIHGLIKGKRQGEYNPETRKYDGTIRQQSVFCYAYRKPAVPPMEPEEWADRYEWYDDFEGKTKRLPKAFKKAGVWEIPDDLLSEPGMSKAEFWAKWMSAETRKKQLIILGPFSRQTQMVEHFLEEARGEEQRWQLGLWRLYELAETLQAEAQTADYWDVVWPHPEYQRALDLTFPRSYACRRYGMRNRCQFEYICLQREGWLDPMGSGQYIERRPHHRQELEQAIGRGLLIPEEGAAEDIEQELP
jgi:hypothetical protein